MFSGRRAAGLAIAFVGVVVVVTLGAGQSVSLDNAKGPLLVLLAPISFAAYNVMAKPLLTRHSPIAVSSAATLAGTVALLPFIRGSWVGDARAHVGVRLAAGRVSRADLHAVRLHCLDAGPAIISTHRAPSPTCTACRRSRS